MAVAAIKKCTVEDCGRDHSGHGMCGRHLLERRRKWTAEDAGAACAIEGCDRGPYAKGLCFRHYLRAKNGWRESKASINERLIKTSHETLMATLGRAPTAEEIRRDTGACRASVYFHLRRLGLARFLNIRPVGKRYSPDGWPICQHCEKPIDPAEKRWNKLRHNACHSKMVAAAGKATRAAKRAAKKPLPTTDNCGTVGSGGED